MFGISQQKIRVSCRLKMASKSVNRFLLLGNKIVNKQRGSSALSVILGTMLMTASTYAVAAGVNTFSGSIDMNNHKIIDVATPTANGDAANKAYVDAQASVGLPVGLPTQVVASVSYQTIFQAASTCNALTSGSHSDWRLPTLFEADYMRNAGTFGAVTSAVWTRTPVSVATRIKIPPYISIILYATLVPSTGDVGQKAATVTTVKSNCVR